METSKLNGYLTVIATLILILEGFGAYNSRLTQEEASSMATQAAAFSDAVSSIKVLQTTQTEQNKLLDRLANTVSNMGVRYDMSFEGVKKEMDNLWNAPRPDNTARAISNSEKNIQQDGVLGNHELRIEQLEKRHEIEK